MKIFGFKIQRQRPVTMKAVPKTQDVKMPVQGGRQTVPDTVGLFSALTGEMTQVVPDFELELIRVIEHLAKYNGDISYAVDNIVQLSNTPYVVSFGDNISEDLAKELTAAVKQNEKDLYKGGLNSLINDLLAQVAITGAISSEIVPNDNLDDVKKVVLVDTSKIKFIYDQKKDSYIPCQQVKNTIATLSNLKPLNEITYKYYAIRRFGEKPYAIPPFMASLESVEIEKDMICSLKSIVKKLGVFGFMSILVNPPTKNLNENDDQYMDRCLRYLQSIRPEAEKGFNSGLSLGFRGSHEFKMENTTMNVAGAKELFDLVSTFKMAGLKQDPLMLGRNFNVAETMARVILAKLTTQVANMQQLLASFLEDLFTLRLLLLGYSADQVANIKVEFQRAMVSDQSKEEEAYGKKIENNKALFQQGIINQQQFAQNTGYDKPAEEEPLAPQIDPNNLIGVDEGNDPTSTAEKKKKAKASNSVYLTKTQIRELLDTPENAAGHHIADIVLLNGEVIEDVDIFNCTRVESLIAFNPFDVSAINVVSLSDLENMLGKQVEEFNYSSCTPERLTDVSHFAKDAGDIFAHLDSYYKATKSTYTKASKKVTGKIAKALGDLTDASTLEQVQDRVMYILYKNWDGDFSQAQKKVINKWVDIAYKSFRKDKEVFGEKKGVPEGTFGLRDTRTMEYFKNSDSLYLGKFITDEDVKKKITAFVKEEYLNKGLPIGKGNTEILDAFKEKFEGVLGGLDWKIVSVLSTTVNKMRNYAAVSYLEQAQVEKFEIRGVVDRLQCEYCKSMQGRQFSVALSLSKLDAVVTTSPAYVSTITPFVNTVFKGKDGIEELKSLSDDAVQARGVDLPSYHCNCRDRIVAVV